MPRVEDSPEAKAQESAKVTPQTEALQRAVESVQQQLRQEASLAINGLHEKVNPDPSTVDRIQRGVDEALDALGDSARKLADVDVDDDLAEALSDALNGNADIEALEAVGQEVEKARLDAERNAEAPLDATASDKDLARQMAARDEARKDLETLGAMREVLDAATDAREAVSEARALYVQERMEQLRSQGHGPGRHGPQVTPEQLRDRLLEWKDPMNGTKVDEVHGGHHRCSDNATKVASDEAYVQADDCIRASDAFHMERARAEAAGEKRFPVEMGLETIYGDAYRDKVDGLHREGPPPDSGGNPAVPPPTNIDFTGGTMKGIYQRTEDGGWATWSMYPQPQTEDE